MGQNKIERVDRQVIERKLLTALDDESKVAILATKQDLELLLEALTRAISAQTDWKKSRRIMDYRNDLEQLIMEAFP